MRPHEAFMAPKSDTTPISLWHQRLTRRLLLGRGSELALLSALAPRYALAQRADPVRDLGFETVAPSNADAVVVPPGYRADVLIRWGDPLFPGVPPLDAHSVARGGLLEPSAARAQARQFGYNCDGMGLFDVGGGEALVCVNHEYPNPELLFPGFRAAQRARQAAAFVRENPQCVAFMQAAVGVSVAHFGSSPDWQLQIDSPLNRRITANTPIQLSGPVRGHELLKTAQDPTGTSVNGTIFNCAAGTTPWGTYLTAEEGVDSFFGNRRAARFTRDVERVHNRFRPRGLESRFRWEFADPRFDVALNPKEPFKFGWVVEIDPRDPSAPIKKRTALGRFKHEGATTVVAPDGRVVVYMGDDSEFEYLYKFVTRDAFEPENPEANVDLLDSGTLYVARFSEDGGGEWVPMVWGEHPELTEQHDFHSQGDVMLRCREAADLVGATPMDRPEDIAVSPVTNKVYVACTNNPDREDGELESSGRVVSAGSHSSNPRVPNPWGHIIEISEDGADAAAVAFRWEIFLLAGDPARGQFLATLAPHAGALDPDSTYYAGYAEPDSLSAFAAPDNLTFDDDGNLWITTDGDQPRGNNDGCYVCPTEGVARGAVQRFMSGPVGCEVVGCEITSDGISLLLGVQHPGEGGTVEEPISSWPDGGAAAPRPSVVLVRSEDPRRKLTA